MSSVMRHFRRMCMEIALLGGCLLTACGAPPESISAEPDSTREGMLLLWTGRTVQGRIVKNGDSYSVRRSTGEMFVPAGQVRLECRDLVDAYHKLHAALPPDDIEERLLLARWCLTNQLFPQARQEVSDALSLEPGRADIREMLRKLDDTMVSQQSPEKKPELPDRAAQAAKSAGFDAKDIESLGGLSRESAQTFMRRIQPILMNGCALAGCHTADVTNDFRLQRTSIGSDAGRAVMERNLAAVLRFVDRENPRASPLLTVPQQGNHGRRGGQAFAGTRAKEQSTEMRDWVLKVVKEQSRPGSAPQATRVGNSHNAGSSGKSAVLQKPVNNSSDPFDPAEFNRSAEPPN